MARRVFIDTAPLRQSRQFRLLFIGFLVSTLGNQLTLVAIPFQVYHATHSSLQVGLISLVQLVPLVLGSLIGGSIGDHHDRRKIMIWGTLTLSVTSALLAINAALWDSNLWVLYVVAAVAAFLAGLANPSRTAAVPLLVRGEDLVASMSFLQLVFQYGGIVGPTVAGMIIAFIGVPLTYAIDAGTFLISLATAVAMAPIPPTLREGRPGLRSIIEGFTFLKGKQVLQGVYLADLNAMIFGMPRALFPAMAATVYHVGPGLLGVLYAAPSVGALIGAATTGWVSGIVRRGRAVLIAVGLWGLAIVGFGLASTYWIGLVLLGIAGWADVISAVLRSTILQSSIPDTFRSRLSAIQTAVVQGGPKLGDLESGVVAAATSVEFSVVSGGIICILGVFVLARTHRPFYEEAAPALD